MKISIAILKDLDIIMEIYYHAREYMISTGNPNQWRNTKPTIEQIMDDINHQYLYVCKENDEIIGVFFFNVYEDITYQNIDGDWLNKLPYGVIHRIAVKKHRYGVGTFCIDWAYKKCYNLKIDTHVDNIPMRSLLIKEGFTYCGVILLENGEPRLAYQKTRKMDNYYLLDWKNYDSSFPEIYRISIRGIIFIENSTNKSQDNNLLLVKTNRGTVGFPGGGIEKNETEEQTLIREIHEETGYHVIEDTIKPFLEIEEKRLSIGGDKKEDIIWHHINRYYFCKVKAEHDKCSYTANEMKYEYQPTIISLEEALQINNKVLIDKNFAIKAKREIVALTYIKEYLDKENNK